MSDVKKLIWLIGIFFCLQVDASNWDEAGKLIDQGNYASAIKMLLPLAEGGDLRAQTMLGSIYQHGIEGKADYVQALAWYQKAADENFAMAQYGLGFMYDRGLGVPVDYARAAALYQSAAEQGFAGAQESLAFMYLLGRGVPANKEKSVMWAEKAAKQGVSGAHKMLALSIASEKNAKEDDVRMAYHYAQAADLGDSHSRYLLGTMYIDGQGVAQNRIVGAALFKACLLDVGQTDKNKAFLLEELDYLQLSESEDRAAEKLGHKIAASKNLLRDIEIYLGSGSSK